MRWLFPDSVPLNYSLSPLNALVGAAVIESLELQVGGFDLIDASRRAIRPVGGEFVV